MVSTLKEKVTSIVVGSIMAASKEATLGRLDGGSNLDGDRDLDRRRPQW